MKKALTFSVAILCASVFAASAADAVMQTSPVSDGITNVSSSVTLMDKHKKCLYKDGVLICL